MLKTYWHKLTEEQQITFFDFYIDVTFNKLGVCNECPNPGEEEYYMDEEFHSLCGRLYFYDPLVCGCPCGWFGPAAFEALERTLREEGWID